MPWREYIKGRVIGGVHRNKLALEVARQFGYGHTVLRTNPHHLIAVRLARHSLVQIKDTRIPRWDLYAFIT